MSNFFQVRSAATQVSSGTKVDQPWIEKYRPKNMSDISAQDQAVQVLKKTIESNNLPHLLFYGPPGTGKTSTILALARELFGPELMHTRVLELNASDERGIQVIREKVKNFARTAIGQGVSGYPCPPFKIIILDEADTMTNDAQSALRRTMETYSKVTRFCLICNYVTRIIEPLASRCAKFRFKPLDIMNTRTRLEMISQAEGVVCEPEALDELISASEGDLRRAIMFLQSAYRLHREKKITSDSIREIAGVVPEQVIKRLTSVFHATYDEIYNVVRDIIYSGYSVAQVVNQLHDRIAKDELLTTIQKAKISQAISQIDKYLVDGADEHLQLLDLMVQISIIVK
ncbi:uncharacterized protein VTP21DRAFT_10131 [Calcarisporiella thermophila]|uniref:uncharacterized protein n=1 Tax=Calcarisporiella thermophila TaxID=911321 RepID=UPI003743AB85